MGLEVIQTHNIRTTRLNKRLRQGVDDKEALPSLQVSQLSQLTCNPDSESSKDSDNALEPMLCKLIVHHLFLLRINSYYVHS